MTSNDVREKVDAALKEEQQSHRLRDRVAKVVPASARDEKLGFVMAYLLMTPILLDSVYNEACSQGLLQQFQPIFDAVLGYWELELDVIPDRLGLFGLCDDAYMSLRLMQHLASQVVPGTGKPLLSLDLSVANSNMRAFIREPAASQLDLIVTQTCNALSFQNAVAIFMNNPAFLNAVGGGTWTGGDSADVRRQMQEQMKRNIVKDAVRHDLAKDGIFF